MDYQRDIPPACFTHKGFLMPKHLSKRKVPVGVPKHPRKAKSPARGHKKGRK